MHVHKHTRSESPLFQSQTFSPVTPKSIYTYIVYMYNINTCNDLVLFIILGMSRSHKRFLFCKNIERQTSFYKWIITVRDRRWQVYYILFGVSTGAGVKFKSKTKLQYSSPLSLPRFEIYVITLHFIWNSIDTKMYKIIDDVRRRWENCK